MLDIEAEIGFAQLGLGSVLRQNQLTVPANQRDYAWTEKEVKALFRDFAKSIADGERSYFLGTIVTIPRANGVLEVVDGQQRLGTTAIFLSRIGNYLRTRDRLLAEAVDEFLTGIDRTNRARAPRLRLNLDDNDYFRALLLNEQPLPEPTKTSHRLLRDAFDEADRQIRAIVGVIDEKDHGDLLNHWITFIESKALVVLLRVPNDANAYRMFETLNDRGLRTSQSDLIKNYLFGRAGDRIQEVQQKWTFMRGALETMEDEDITIIFLRHSLTGMYGFVRETDVYEMVQNQVRAAQPAVTFMTTMESLANVYVAIHNPEHEKWNSYSDTTRRAVEVLNLFNIRPLRALMLAIAHKFRDREAQRAFGFLVSLSVRLMIASSTRTGSVEEGLASAAHKIFSEQVTTAAALVTDLDAITPKNASFKAAFEVATISNQKLARYYLRSLEMVAASDPEPWHIPNDDKSVINLEHVLPEKPEGNWPQFTDDQVKLHYRRIGNLCLLRASENSTLKSAHFQTKKPILANSPYVLTRQIGAEAAWTTTEITDRQRRLSDLALRAWPIA